MADHEDHDLKIEVPIDEFIEQVAERAAERALEKHAAQCPIGKLEKRVDKLEETKAVTVGFVAGASAVGGLIGSLAIGVVAVVAKLFGS